MSTSPTPEQPAPAGPERPTSTLTWLLLCVAAFLTFFVVVGALGVFGQRLGLWPEAGPTEPNAPAGWPTNQAIVNPTEPRENR
jgi:hypothetical protein